MHSRRHQRKSWPWRSTQPHEPPAHHGPSKLLSFDIQVCQRRGDDAGLMLRGSGDGMPSALHCHRDCLKAIFEKRSTGRRADGRLSNSQCCRLAMPASKTSVDGTCGHKAASMMSSLDAARSGGDAHCGVPSGPYALVYSEVGHLG